MKSIVTGGAGFIGSHLVSKLLENKHEVVVLDNFSTGRLENISNNKVKIIECDISINGEWEKEFNNADYVFHTAALADIVPSIQNPQDYFNSNVVGTFNLIQKSIDKNIAKFVYLASGSCYGIPDNYPTSETSKIDTEYPYALTKNLGESLVLHWSKVYNLPAISLRLFNVYGTKSRTSGTYGAVIGTFLAQKISNKPFTVVGDGSQKRDFTHVRDVVEAIIKAIESDIVGEYYNVGSGKSVSINQLVKLLGPNDVINIPKRPGEPDNTFADISKIKKYLNWEPKVSIAEGVKDLLENIDYWKNAPVWDPEKIEVATKDWFKYLGN